MIRTTIMILALVLAAGCARAPYRMAVTDWSGKAKPYYYAGQALALTVFWDANRDTGKPITCSFSDSFSGETVWKGTLMIPNFHSGQWGTAVFNPPFPERGIKLQPGNYLALCIFNDEARASIPLAIKKGPGESLESDAEISGVSQHVKQSEIKLIKDGEFMRFQLNLMECCVLILFLIAALRRHLLRRMYF